MPKGSKAFDITSFYLNLISLLVRKGHGFRIVLLTCKQSATGTRNHILRNQIQLGNHPGTRRECQP